MKSDETPSGLRGVTASVNRTTVIGPPGRNEQPGPRRRLLDKLGLKSASDTQLITEAVELIESMEAAESGENLPVATVHVSELAPPGETPLGTLKLDPAIVEALVLHSGPIVSIEKLQAYMEDNTLTDIKGIGKGRAQQIAEALEQFTRLGE